MKLKVMAVTAAAALLLGGCAATSGGKSSDTIKIGASLPLTGSLASFGPVLQEGYQAAVDGINAKGGISIGGTKQKVELVVLDSASDATKVADQSKTLILRNNVVGLLGSVSPALAIPASNTADLQKVPFVGSLTPVESWKAGNSSGWKYSWDLFFDEKQQTSLPFQTADLTSTNKKVALFTDTEEDGIAMGKLWDAKAPALGYSIAYHASFPVGTTDFTQYVNAAKAAGADIVVTQMIPPDAFALWKQMKAAAYSPKVAFCEKCAAQGAFSKALGALAEGTSVSGLAAPTAGVLDKFSTKYGNTVDFAQFAAAYSVASVLIGAIVSAGSTDPTAINTAIGKTNLSTPVGTIKFDKTHADELPAVARQWQGTSQVQVLPKLPGVTLQAPVGGLK
jgi:branched-chain amino acid transport system substrate-binding protein